MTDHVARLYAATLALVAFFLTRVVVAARPWAAEATVQDPKVAALERREQRLRTESMQVQRRVERRFAEYRASLAERQRELAAVQAAPASSVPAPTAPSVGVVSLPPVTSTRSS
jgi:LPS O-antigen subunit length determinant protein (WzzB/FepE family)